MVNDFRQKKIENSNSNSFWYFRIFKLLIWIIIFVVFFIFYSYKNFESKVLINEDKVVTIEKLDTFNNLWLKINELNTFHYKIYIKNNEPDFSLQEWTYNLKSWQNITEVLESLDKPIYEEMNITFLEWWNIYDIDYYLMKKWLINKWDYISYVNNEDKIQKLSKFFNFIETQKTLEWFLYPDTYKINAAKFKINELVIKQLENFEEKVYEKILINLNNEQINDLVNLASIVEKEEKNPNEKPTVAGILKKRLNNWWMIWADITVCYPHKLTSQECKMVVTKYINEKSEYNTRTKLWLPKTPIWNPSYETINATLNDKETDYWFYLHNIKSWKIYYGKTNQEHERNKKYMY